MKVYLAVVENCSLDELLKIKPKYILESFASITNVSIEYSHSPHCKSFLLDSGAFTFMNNQKKGKQMDFDSFLAKYIDFINTHDVKLFFELDVDVIIGYEKVKALRKTLETRTGKKCIPVWHKSRGVDDYIEMVKEYDYVAIGGIAIGEIKRSDYKHLPWFIAKAHENNCKIHGLGFTGTSHLKDYKFDSVDSSSWMMSVAYGRLVKFNNQVIKALPKPKNARAKIEKRNDIKLHNLREWVKYQHYMDKRRR